MLGEERVTKFVIQEIVNSTMADYVKKENLNVKDNKINTTQTAEELMSVFTPGKEFGFNATLELETSEIKTSS
ncbi:trigger factor [Fagus crenata]